VEQVGKSYDQWIDENDLNVEVVFRGEDVERILDACERLGYQNIGAGVAAFALVALQALA
jgi:hypothetical protein